MRRAALGAGGLALALGSAAAEPAPDAEIDEEIVVYGVRTGVFDPIPGASSDRLDLDAFSAENKRLADLLSETPGVSVRRFGAAGDRSEVSIRGSTASQVVVTIDGVRANSALTGGLDLSRLCLPLLESVEITRSAGASQLGSGAIGGVVNLVTRAAGAQRVTRAGFAGGAFDTWEGSLLHGDAAGELDYSLGYCGFATQGDFEFLQPTLRGDGVEGGFDPRRATRLNNDREQHGATLGLRHPLGTGALSLSSYFVHSEGGEPGFDGASDPSAGQNTEARSRDLANLAQLRWEGAPPAWLGEELSLSLHHRYERSEFEDPAVIFTPPFDVTARLQHAGLRERNRWRWRGDGRELAIGLQIDGTHDRLRASDRRGVERESAGAALDAKLELFERRVSLAASARVDWADGFGAELLPHLGLVLSPWPWLRLRAQGGRAHRVPTFDELFHPDEGFIVGNPDLEPEDARNADAGLEVTFAELGPLRDVELGASAFWREIDESIVWLQASPSTLRPENTGPATVRGFELTGAFGITRFVRLSVHHTALASRRDRSGRRLPATPPRETFARLRLGEEGIWKLVGELQHVGAILVNEGGSRRLRARTVWSASAALNLVEWPGLGLERLFWELWVFAELNNIGDEAVRDSEAFPQPGRNGSAGLELRW